MHTNGKKIVFFLFFDVMFSLEKNKSVLTLRKNDDHVGKE